MQLVGRRTYAVCIVIAALAAVQKFFDVKIPPEIFLGLFALAVATLRASVGKTPPLLLLALLLSAGSVWAQATSFSGTFRATTTWQHTKSVGAATLTETLPTLFAWTHESGSGDGQMALFVSDQAVLGAGGSNVVNLAAAVDGFGDTVAFGRVGFFALRASVSNAAELAVSGADWAAAAPIAVQPGGLLMFVSPHTNGYVVGSATNVWIVNGSASSNAWYDLYVGGTP